MNKSIEKIHKQYGDIVFRMALTHLFNVGVDRLLNADIEEDCASLIADTPDNALIPGQTQAEIHRCAAELAKIDLWEILKYIQTEIRIDGVQTHPGKFIRFCNQNTGSVITEFCVSCDADDEYIREVVDIMGVTSSMSVSRDVVAESIRRAFRMKGIRPEPIEFDTTFEI